MNDRCLLPSEHNQWFDQLINGHRRLSKGRGPFAMSVDQELCVWGIGLANWCRWKGIPVAPRPPLIPEPLLSQA